MYDIILLTITQPPRRTASVIGLHLPSLPFSWGFSFLIRVYIQYHISSGCSTVAGRPCTL